MNTRFTHDVVCDSYGSRLDCAGRGISSFSGLPLTPLDQRFSTITEVYNPGASNYHGVMASVTRRMNAALQLQASFTYSHALDDSRSWVATHLLALCRFEANSGFNSNARATATARSSSGPFFCGVSARRELASHDQWLD